MEGLEKSFGPKKALEGVDLAVGADELLVILGPTGAGKTTLLRVLAGLEKPDAGRVLIGDVEVTHQSPAARDLAMVFQNFSLYPDWTVRRNLEFPLKAPGRNLGAEEVSKRVKEAAALLQIERLLDRPSQALSGGEMQRVALGRALVRRPRLFLMDEPLTNLDAKLREDLRVELVELRRRLGVPMVFVTHDQEDAMSMADRVAVLDQGRILQIGTPDDIYQKPAGTTVARQLGRPRINLFPFEALPPSLRGRGWKNGQTIGVRPEDLRLESGPIEALVRVVENQGHSKILVLDWLGQDVHALDGPGSRFKPGDRLRPCFKAPRTLVWDA